MAKYYSHSYKRKNAYAGGAGILGWLILASMTLTLVAWVVQTAIFLSRWLYSHHKVPMLLSLGFMAGLFAAYLLHKAAKIVQKWKQSKAPRSIRSSTRPFSESPCMTSSAPHPFLEISLDHLSAEKALNSRGYIVLVKKHLEHRYLAEQALGRSLSNQECVHHINGRKDDNTLTNLCVMDRTKHELFHTWLRWKKEKSGSYPAREEIERVLVKEYEGVLLSPFTVEKMPAKLHLVTT